MLQEKIKTFPTQPGVYWMKDEAGVILYIGKAKNLRSRVRAYFKKEERGRYQIDFLMRKTRDIEFLVTANEKEALLLENTLIKKQKPRYNVFLKDDKSFASLKINSAHNFPGIFITRNIVKDGSQYFGPYSSAKALRQTVDLVTRHFKLRTCSDHEFANRSRPCLEYQIGRCSAPCVGKVSQEEYEKQIAEAKLFLQGRSKDLIQILKEKMKKASQQEHYEEAAKARDLIFYIRETLEKQKVIRHGGNDYDVIGHASNDQDLVVCVLMIRSGVLLDRQKFLFSNALKMEGEFLAHFLLQYYGEILEIPSAILLPDKIEDLEELKNILSEKSQKKIEILSPTQGEKKKMVMMAIQNAKEWLKALGEKHFDLTLALKERLCLAQAPRVIECVDISNIQGEEACGSLVCFEEGRPLKNRYRKFKIYQTQGPNDYAMMYEVLFRRFRRILKAATQEEKEKWALPDLLLIDGGKGQLAVAKKVLADLGLHQLAIASIAKPPPGARHPMAVQDKIYILDSKEAIHFKPRDPVLLYLMRIRDEAHRFGITYHRKLRLKKMKSDASNF